MPRGPRENMRELVRLDLFKPIAMKGGDIHIIPFFWFNYILPLTHYTRRHIPTFFSYMDNSINHEHICVNNYHARQTVALGKGCVVIFSCIIPIWARFAWVERNG
jgi:hypothetical protein